MTDEIEKPTTEGRAKRTPAAKAPAAPTLPQDIGSIIPRIREELKFVGKDQETESGTRYKYRGHDQIVNEIVPLFNKYGVYTTVSDQPVHYEGRNAGTKYVTASQLLKAVTFWAPDGSSRVSTILSESTDYGNKATGQASTYAYRIALEQTFTIPTGLPDPDANADEAPPTSEPVAPPQPAAPQNTAALDAIRKEIKDLFAAQGVTVKEEVIAKGSKFFNGRENWFEAAPLAPMTKLRDALAAGEAVGE